MSNNNNEFISVAFVIAGFLIFAQFLFAVVAFVALLLTVLCFAAWNRPITLFGEVLTSEEARAFVARGVAGALLVPGFALFASLLLNFRMTEDGWMYCALGGYSFGSLVVECMIQNAKDKAAQAAQTQIVIPPLTKRPPDDQTDRDPHHPTAPQPFRFASWDDEGERRS